MVWRNDLADREEEIRRMEGRCVRVYFLSHSHKILTCTRIT